jgi:hypothetical protein
MANGSHLVSGWLKGTLNEILDGLSRKIKIESFCYALLALAKLRCGSTCKFANVHHTLSPLSVYYTLWLRRLLHSLEASYCVQLHKTGDPTAVAPREDSIHVEAESG